MAESLSRKLFSPEIQGTLQRNGSQIKNNYLIPILDYFTKLKRKNFYARFIADAGNRFMVVCQNLRDKSFNLKPVIFFAHSCTLIKFSLQNFIFIPVSSLKLFLFHTEVFVLHCNFLCCRSKFLSTRFNDFAIN